MPASRSSCATRRLVWLLPQPVRAATTATTGPDGEELLTRISEGVTEWRCQGRTGHGLSEYLDQIVDGRPVGYDG